MIAGAISCLDKAVNYFLENGRDTMAAKYCKVFIYFLSFWFIKFIWYLGLPLACLFASELLGNFNLCCGYLSFVSLCLKSMC